MHRAERAETCSSSQKALAGTSSFTGERERALADIGFQTAYAARKRRKTVDQTAPRDRISPPASRTPPIEPDEAELDAAGTFT